MTRDPKDLRNVGTYGLPETSHYLSLPESTLRTWVRGRRYPTADGKGFSPPLITLPDPQEPLLSFTNLVEAHVLAAIRRRHGVPMQRVRTALRYLERVLQVPHPLARQELLTDGVDLFVERFGQLVNLSREGQLAVKELIQAHLRRIEHDASGLAQRLYPFTRGQDLNPPKVVVLDPRISFGRPVIDGTGVRTEVIANRLKAGESVRELAKDYGLEIGKIEEAIRYELAA